MTLYERLGGEAGLRKLVNRFYELMCTLPEAEPIRRMHPEDIALSEEKLFLFLSGWTGGPSLYIEKYGHPRLRMRHFPFSIGDEERDQWMLCMRHALQESGLDAQLAQDLEKSFLHVADHMRNREPG